MKISETTIKDLKRYDYREAVKADALELARTDFTDLENYWNYDDLKESIYDGCMQSDSVTGNGAKGRYTDFYTASFYLAGNWDLLRVAYLELGYGLKNSPVKVDIIEKGACWCDCLIRCYVLGEVLDDIFKELDIDEHDRRFQMYQTLDEEEDND